MIAQRPIAPITVNLLTGFLGSGKTSLLRRLLREPELADVAVLINEFGEVGLDHLLLDKIEEDVVVLQSGCVCCSIRGELKEALVRLHGRIARGEIPPVSRVVIETTGLADPAPIVATIIVDPVVRHHFRLGNVITVVDGMNGETTLRDHSVSLRQAAVADRLIISKVDLATQIGRLRSELRRINPTAPILESTEDAAAPVSLLVSDLHDERTKEAEVLRWLDADRADAHAHGAVRSLCLTAEEPLGWTSFGLWLSMLLNRHGDRVLRVKGILDIEGAASPVVVHGVQHLIHKPVHLAAWPGNDRRSRLIVIVDGLDPVSIRRSFEAFRHLGRSARASADAKLSARGIAVVAD